MRLRPSMCVAVVCFLLTATDAAAEPCRDPARALGVARIVEIDAANGPVFGTLTSQQFEKRFLEPKEVVLTFDDGPMPAVTRSVLDTLDRFCTKATFFSVGRMAVAYPELVREVLDRGHTLGTHTWSHPLSLPRLGFDRARDQIDSGFAAVALAAGRPIAPFFRFPGLSDSYMLLGYLQHQRIATFSVDVVSNDSYISDPGRLLARTLERAEAEQGGILLFHDIKHVTARALPDILVALKARGYRVAHLRPKAPYTPDERQLAAVTEHIRRSSAKKQLVAITGLEGADAPSLPHAARATAGDNTLPVTQITPPARERLAGKRLPAVDEGTPTIAASSQRPVTAQASSKPVPTNRAAPPSDSGGGWAHTLKRWFADIGG